MKWLDLKAVNQMHLLFGYNKHSSWSRPCQDRWIASHLKLDMAISRRCARGIGMENIAFTNDSWNTPVNVVTGHVAWGGLAVVQSKFCKLFCGSTGSINNCDPTACAIFERGEPGVCEENKHFVRLEKLQM